MSQNIQIKGARISFPGFERPVEMLPYQQETIRSLTSFRMQGRFTPRYVSNKLRRELGWNDLASNAKLARKRRHIEQLIAQRVGRR